MENDALWHILAFGRHHDMSRDGDDGRDNDEGAAEYDVHVAGM